MLVASGAVGCSGGDAGRGQDDAPTAEVFCGALEEFQDQVKVADPADIAAYVQALKAAAEQLERVGAPEDIPDPARAGLELTVQRIADLPDDATQEDLSSLGDVGGQDEASLDALEDYIKQACPGLTGS